MAARWGTIDVNEESLARQVQAQLNRPTWYYPPELLNLPERAERECEAIFDSIRAQAERVAVQNRELQKHIVTKDETIANLEIDLVNWRSSASRIPSLEARIVQLESSAAHTAQLEAEISRVKSQLEVAHLKNQNLEVMAAKRSTELADMTSRSENLEQLLTDSREQERDLGSHIEALKSEMEVANAQKQAYGTEKQSLELQKQILKNKIEDLNAQIEELRSTNRDLQTQLTNLIGCISSVERGELLAERGALRSETSKEPGLKTTYNAGGQNGTQAHDVDRLEEAQKFTASASAAPKSSQPVSLQEEATSSVVPPVVDSQESRKNLSQNLAQRILPDTPPRPLAEKDSQKPLLREWTSQQLDYIHQEPSSPRELKFLERLAESAYSHLQSNPQRLEMLISDAKGLVSALPSPRSEALLQNLQNLRS